MEEQPLQIQPQRESTRSWAMVMLWSMLCSGLSASLLALLAKFPILAMLLVFPLLGLAGFFGMATWSQAHYSSEAGRTGNAWLGQLIGALLMLAPLLQGLDHLRRLFTA